MKLSIAIPTYESKGRGCEFLLMQFEKFISQTFKDFEVVISDHSKNNEIKNLCSLYSNILNIKYIKNEYNRGISSSNINNALKNCSGDLIKILFQDDFLWDSHSLKKIVESFSEHDNWLVSACEHTNDNGITFIRPFYPRYHNKIYLGINTISSPSVLTIRNDNKILFDERLIWLMDVDYYKMCYNKFGIPKILNEITVVNRISNEQLTSSMSEKIKNIELNLMIKKHGE
jgi:hypothetical protein